MSSEPAISEDFTQAKPASSSLAWRNVGNASHELTPSGLLVKPAAKTDMWQRTFYGFQVNNAPQLATAVTGDFVAITRSSLSPVHKYDQAGLLCYFDEHTWLKTSCEYIPGGPSKLGAVVTNAGFSDWSTQPASGASLSFEFRIGRLGDAYMVHVRASEQDPWFLVRLAHLGADAASVPCYVGLYACCPLGEGGSAVFDRLEIRRPTEGELSLH